MPFMTKGQGEKGSWLWIPKGSTIQVTGTGTGDKVTKPKPCADNNGGDWKKNEKSAKCSDSYSAGKWHSWPARKQNRSKRARARAKRAAERLMSSTNVNDEEEAESEEEFEMIKVEDDDQHSESWQGGQKEKDWQSWKVVKENHHWQSWPVGKKDQDWQSWKVVKENHHWQSWPVSEDQDWQSWKVIKEDDHWHSWPVGEKDQDSQSWQVVEEDEHWQSWPWLVGEEDQHWQDHDQEVQAWLQQVPQDPQIVPPRWNHPVGEVAKDVRRAFGVAVELSALRVAKPKSKSQPPAQTQSQVKRKPKVILPPNKQGVPRKLLKGRPSTSSKLKHKLRARAKPSARVKPGEGTVGQGFSGEKPGPTPCPTPRPKPTSSVKQEIEDNEDMIACVEVSWTEPEPGSCSDGNDVMHFMEEMKPEQPELEELYQQIDDEDGDVLNLTHDQDLNGMEETTST